MDEPPQSPDAVTLTYRHRVAALFGFPLLAFGLVGLVWAAWSWGQLTGLGRVVVPAGALFLAGSGLSFLRYWFVTVTLRESGVVLTDLVGRPRPEVPWGSVVVSAKTLTAAHTRMVLICEGEHRRRQQLWGEMWIGFEDAVEWMRVRPQVRGRWDAGAERADQPGVTSEEEHRRGHRP